MYRNSNQKECSTPQESNKIAYWDIAIDIQLLRSFHKNSEFRLLTYPPTKNPMRQDIESNKVSSALGIGTEILVGAGMSCPCHPQG
jgi:hypothetical protein